jgi:alpha-amylase
MRTKIAIPVIFILLLAAPSHSQAQSLRDDIFYQIFPIAFRDSDGDSVGDFAGIAEAVPYLQDLGVTAVWMNPVFLAWTYHGYQYVRHDSLNPKFGTEAEFIAMVEDLHDAGIKVLVDLVAYGVAEEHPFFQDAWGNPGSAYDLWFSFTNPGNTDYFGFGGGYTDWEGNSITHVFWNHNHLPVRQHLIDELSYWLDPDDDGNFHDGIDGFRIDHLSVGWSSEAEWGYDLPLWDDLTEGLRAVNPGVIIIAEDSDWGNHHPDIFLHGIDGVFDVPLMFGVRWYLNNDAGWDLAQNVATNLTLISGDGQWLGLLNNHDVTRIRTELGNDLDLCRLGAAWLFTGPFPPVMYAGEEIGMRGYKVDWYGNDANDLHIRETFEWSTNLVSPPHAYWFGHRPEYAANEFIQDGDGVSVQEQESDTTSLLYHYRKLATLRGNHETLRSGGYFAVWPGDSRVCSFLRSGDSSSVYVALNFSNSILNLNIDFTTTPLGSATRTVMDLWGDESYPNITPANADDYPLHLGRESFAILGISGTTDTAAHRVVFQTDLSSWDPPPDLFPPGVRGDEPPLSWFSGHPTVDIGAGLWQAEVDFYGFLHGQTVEYKYKLSGRGFDEHHSLGWVPGPNLTFEIDTTQHPQLIQYDGSGWPQPYEEHPVKFSLDLSHWEEQPLGYDLELRGDWPPLDWSAGLDMEYQGDSTWTRTDTMVVTQDTWFNYKYKLNAHQFTEHSLGWSPDPDNLVYVDTTITPFLVEYDGTPWDQPYSDSAPAAINDLTAILAGNGLYLTWSAITENIIGEPIVVDHYTIYRGIDPGFSPGSEDSIGSTSSTFYDDPTPALKDPETNHFYVVKAVDVTGEKSSDSNRVGEFDRVMINGKK